MTPQRDVIGALCGLGAALDAFGEAWQTWLAAYEAVQLEAYNRGGLEAVRALTATMGLDIVTAGVRDRMIAVGLGPLLKQGSTDRAEKSEALTGRGAELWAVGSESIQ